MRRCGYRKTQMPNRQEEEIIMPVGKVVKTDGFCKRVEIPKGRFDPRSFRTIRTGKSLRTVACPRGAWDAKAPKGKQCRVGMKVQRVLKKKTIAGKCPIM